MLRILIVLVFFSSCNKNIYSKKGDDGSIRHLSLLWKKSGEYRGAFAAYKINQYNWSGVTVYKSDCDSFRIDRWQKLSGNKKANIRFYSVSRKGKAMADISAPELQLLKELKHIADSLNWCCFNILSNPDSLFLHEIPGNKKTSR